MRLLHPETIRIIAKMKREEFVNATSSQRQVLSHAWSEVIKFKAGNKPHPKMFIHSDTYLGYYMAFLYGIATSERIGCKFNKENLERYEQLYEAFLGCRISNAEQLYEDYFDRDYLISDANSLYLKGINIFPYIYGDDWKKYCPIVSLGEIHRVVAKSIKKEVR